MNMKRLSNRLDKLEPDKDKPLYRIRIRYDADDIQGITDAEIDELEAQGYTVHLLTIDFDDETTETTA